MNIHILSTHHLSLPYIQEESRSLWPMLVVCEQLGINWQEVSEKLVSAGFKPVEMPARLPSVRAKPPHTCLDQHELNVWLQTLDEGSLPVTAQENLQALKRYVRRIDSVWQTSPVAFLQIMIMYRLQHFSDPWDGMLESVERSFAKAYGTDLNRVNDEGLTRAVEVLCVILATLEKTTTATTYARAEMIVSRLVVTIGHAHWRADTADIAELMSTIEKARNEDW